MSKEARNLAVMLCHFRAPPAPTVLVANGMALPVAVLQEGNEELSRRPEELPELGGSVFHSVAHAHREPTSELLHALRRVVPIRLHGDERPRSGEDPADSRKFRSRLSHRLGELLERRRLDARRGDALQEVARDRALSLGELRGVFGQPDLALLRRHSPRADELLDHGVNGRLRRPNARSEPLPRRAARERLGRMLPCERGDDLGCDGVPHRGSEEQIPDAPRAGAGLDYQISRNITVDDFREKKY